MLTIVIIGITVVNIYSLFNIYQTYFKFLTWVILFNPQNNPDARNYSYPHFTDENLRHSLSSLPQYTQLAGSR